MSIDLDELEKDAMKLVGSALVDVGRCPRHVELKFSSGIALSIFQTGKVIGYYMASGCLVHAMNRLPWTLTLESPEGKRSGLAFYAPGPDTEGYREYQLALLEKSLAALYKYEYSKAFIGHELPAGHWSSIASDRILAEEPKGPWNACDMVDHEFLRTHEVRQELGAPRLPVGLCFLDSEGKTHLVGDLNAEGGQCSCCQFNLAEGVRIVGWTMVKKPGP